MDELHQELLEHADGQPASARLTLALEHSAQLRAELEQARRQSALLKSRLAPWRLAPDRTRQLAKEISDQLPGRMHLLWRTGIAAAVAACMVVAVGGIYMLFGADPAPQPIPVAREEHAPIWRVERFTPSNVAEVLHREQTLKSGEALELGAQEYATIIDPGTGASCLALPGSRLTANGALKLERGSVEARSGAPISAAGKSYQSQAAFLISVSGASTQLDVYNGNVTQSENGNSRALDKGRHIEGSSHHFAGVEAQAAYARGFEAWHARNWSTARMQLEIASQSDKIGAPLRSIAHFYWFAAAGCEGDKAAAVDIGESFLKRYPQDIHLDYIRYFTGEYLRDMGQL
nr:hypothetical protein [Planctomycetota bacterium]